MRSCFRLLLLLLAAISPGLSQELPPSRAAAPLTILQINDVYTIGKVDRGQAGGLARVATLKQQFQKQGKPVLFVLAGNPAPEDGLWRSPIYLFAGAIICAPVFPRLVRFPRHA